MKISFILIFDVLSAKPLSWNTVLRIIDICTCFCFHFSTCSANVFFADFTNICPAILSGLTFGNERFRNTKYRTGIENFSQYSNLSFKKTEKFVEPVNEMYLKIVLEEVEIDEMWSFYHDKKHQRHYRIILSFAESGYFKSIFFRATKS